MPRVTPRGKAAPPPGAQLKARSNLQGHHASWGGWLRSRGVTCGRLATPRVLPPWALPPVPAFGPGGAGGTAATGQHTRAERAGGIKLGVERVARLFPFLWEASPLKPSARRLRPPFAALAWRRRGRRRRRRFAPGGGRLRRRSVLGFGACKQKSARAVSLGKATAQAGSASRSTPINSRQCPSWAMVPTRPRPSNERSAPAVSTFRRRGRSNALSIRVAGTGRATLLLRFRCPEVICL